MMIKPITVGEREEKVGVGRESLSPFSPFVPSARNLVLSLDLDSLLHEEKVNFPRLGFRFTFHCCGRAPKTSSYPSPLQEAPFTNISYPCQRQKEEGSET